MILCRLKQSALTHGNIYIQTWFVYATIAYIFERHSTLPQAIHPSAFLGIFMGNFLAFFFIGFLLSVKTQFSSKNQIKSNIRCDNYFKISSDELNLKWWIRNSLWIRFIFKKMVFISLSLFPRKCFSWKYFEWLWKPDENTVHYTKERI